jgi:hypothetical protein
MAGFWQLTACNCWTSRILDHRTVDTGCCISKRCETASPHPSQHVCAGGRAISNTHITLD